MVNKLREKGFVAIFRNIPEEKLEEVARAVYRGGVRCFEITFNPSDANTIKNTKRAFKTVREAVGDDVILGAGTVIKAEYVKAAKECGAEFIVSPNTDAAVIKATKELGMLSIPGAFTPTEIVNAYQMGADIVKIFPILPDNIAYLKNILAPISHIPFIPTGGVNPDTAKAFMDLGAVAVAAGATIVTPKALAECDYGAIEANARAHIAAIGK